MLMRLMQKWVDANEVRVGDYVQGSDKVMRKVTRMYHGDVFVTIHMGEYEALCSYNNCLFIEREI